MASAKDGLPATFQSETHGSSVLGAASGRSCTPTAIVTMITATRIHGRPTQASQVIFPSVRTLEKAKPTIAAIATKAAVHVACVETAFKPIDRLRIAEPLLKMKSA